METIDYNKIFDYLSDFLPNEWEKLIFFAIIGDGSYSMKFFVDRGNGELIDCFKLSDINKSSLNVAFSNIYNEVQPQRESLPKDKQWSSFIMQINSDGKFNVKFSYDDVSGSMLKKIREIEKIIRNIK